jgi:hypothetical protein
MMHHVGQIARQPGDEHVLRVVHGEKARAERKRTWTAQIRTKRHAVFFDVARFSDRTALVDQFPFLIADATALSGRFGNEQAPAHDPHQPEDPDYHKRRAPPEGQRDQADDRSGDRITERLPGKGKTDHRRRFVTRKPVGYRAVRI